MFNNVPWIFYSAFIPHLGVVKIPNLNLPKTTTKINHSDVKSYHGKIDIIGSYRRQASR